MIPGKRMEFYSTRDHGLRASLEEAVIRGMPADGGLYMPARLPRLAPDFFRGLAGLSFPDAALHLAEAWFGDDIPAAELAEIVGAAFSFAVPLVPLSGNAHVLELFHGPTLAFKDFGARFQSRLMAYLRRGADRTLHVLVATSGDTGSAVASGFFAVPGIRVVILYPAGKISPLQERQIATFGGNITALEIDGVFDDCQRLVKAAFADRGLRAKMDLSSANSINIARLLPQSFYYAHAWSRLDRRGGRTVIAVPSGNFGNLTAGLLGKRMGLPVDRFVAATNVNDAVPEYLRTGKYRPRPSIPTIANAMDVGDPSNFERMLDLYGGDWRAMRRDVAGSRLTEEQIRGKIRDVYAGDGYVCDPHTAVALAGLEKFLARRGEGWQGIALATAHPAKFPEIVEPLIGRTLEIPASLLQAKKREKLSLGLSNDFADFREFLTRSSG